MDASGRTLGQSQTQRVGQAHAEIMALRAAREAGHDVRCATAYVTRWSTAPTLGARRRVVVTSL